MAQFPLERWWIYQNERFPVVKNGILIAIFSLASVGYSRLLEVQFEGVDRTFPIQAGAIAFPVLFLVFLQLRVADEFKDYADDVKYRSYRPVPRGLVSLSELAIVAIAAGVIQLGLTLSLGGEMLIPLGILWSYLGLMTKEFFVPRWLKAHPVIYLLSHNVIMPLMAFFATACHWISTDFIPPVQILWLLGLSIFVGISIEVGRKIRAPQDEEPGVETYSALWGRSQATMVWLMAIAVTTVMALLATAVIQSVWLTALCTLLILSFAIVVAWRFVQNPSSNSAKKIEWVTAATVLLMYLCVGILPFWVSISFS